jgi:hypothetical protein
MRSLAGARDDMDPPQGGEMRNLPKNGKLFEFMFMITRTYLK